MLEKTNSLCVNQLINHIAENCSYGIESFVCVTDVRQASLIEKDLLDDEDSNGFRKFGSSFHDTQAQRDNFSREKEVDDRGVVILLMQH